MTIYDIARQASVSPSTVSRVINGKGEISGATRDRILRLVNESDYKPNSLAKGLAGCASRTVAIVLLDARETHHAALLYYAERTFGIKSYSCFAYSLSGQQNTLSNHLDRMQSHQIDGIIFTGSVFASSPHKEIIQEKIMDIPTVIINATLPGDNFYGIVYNEKKAFREAVDFLVKQKGRHHIAFISGATTISEEQKQLGYREGMTSNGLGANIIVMHSLHTIQGGLFATEALLREHPEIDAILYAVDIMAAGGLQALRKAGRRSPEDIAVIGSNNSDYAQICEPTLTSIDPHPDIAGKMAAEALIAAIEHLNPPKLQTLTCSLVEREST